MCDVSGSWKSLLCILGRGYLFKVVKYLIKCNIKKKKQQPATKVVFWIIILLWINILKTKILSIIPL